MYLVALAVVWGLASSNAFAPITAVSAENSITANSAALTLKLIRQMESNLKLPKGAGPLNSYVRYYSKEVFGGETVIVGTFVNRGGRGEILIVKPGDRPQIFDGGCDVIEMKFSLRSWKTIEINCNGVA